MNALFQVLLGMLFQTLPQMSKSSVRERVALLKEWKGSELPKNIWRNTKIYLYNYNTKNNEKTED
jgi:hypothetical protein